MTGDHISLFSGVGMTDIAAEAAGFKTIATAEVLPFCNDVLDARFPGTYRFEDVREVKYSDFVYSSGVESFMRPLLISGGSPCQGFSDSGYRGGLHDPRSGLLLEMLRIVDEFQPEYVLIENSPLLLKRGGEKVIQRLMDQSYHVRWECIPAAYVGAPHMRDRVWIMARKTPFVKQSGPRKKIGAMPRAGWAGPTWAYEVPPLTTRKQARQGRDLMPTPTKSDGTGGPGVTPKRTGGMNLRTYIAQYAGNGRLNPAYVEWMMGLPEGWTDPTLDNSILIPHPGWTWDTAGQVWQPPTSLTVENSRKTRSKRIQALGNGLVPQVASIALDILVNG